MEYGLVHIMVRRPGSDCDWKVESWEDLSDIRGEFYAVPFYLCSCGKVTTSPVNHAGCPYREEL